jgi:hypothetical protein
MAVLLLVAVAQLDLLVYRDKVALVYFLMTINMICSALAGTPDYSHIHVIAQVIEVAFLIKKKKIFLLYKGVCRVLSLLSYTYLYSCIGDLVYGWVLACTGELP